MVQTRTRRCHRNKQVNKRGKHINLLAWPSVLTIRHTKAKGRGKRLYSTPRYATTIVCCLKKCKQPGLGKTGRVQMRQPSFETDWVVPGRLFYLFCHPGTSFAALLGSISGGNGRKINLTRTSRSALRRIGKLLFSDNHWLRAAPVDSWTRKQAIIRW